MAADTSVAPGAAERAGNAFPVQFGRDGLRALAGEGAQDAPDDFGLLRDDLAIAADRLAAGNSKYTAFVALDPFFDIVMQGLAGAVDGDHYFDAIADDAVFEYRYVFLGFPSKIEGRDALMALYAGYGDSTVLHRGDAIVVHRSQDPSVLIIEYEVHGEKIRTGNSYDNRFISVITIEDRKIVHSRDHMDSLAAFTAETSTTA
jgi:uncharacterized protein